jgi:hypothetical protein
VDGSGEVEFNEFLLAMHHLKSKAGGGALGNVFGGAALGKLTNFVGSFFSRGMGTRINRRALRDAREEAERARDEAEGARQAAEHWECERLRIARLRCEKTRDWRIGRNEIFLEADKDRDGKVTWTELAEACCTLPGSATLIGITEEVSAAEMRPHMDQVARDLHVGPLHVYGADTVDELLIRAGRRSLEIGDEISGLAAIMANKRKSKLKELTDSSILG